MRKAGIYVIESPTGGIYVGQSTNLVKRFNCYKRLDCKGQPGIYNSLLTHTPEKHVFKVVCHFMPDVSPEILDHYEIAYMELFRKNGFEILNIKGGGRHGWVAEETKKQMSILKKGVPRDYFKGELNPYFGKKHSQEARRKMSASNKGNKVGLRNGRARSVYQYTLDGVLINEYETIIQASTSLGISRQSINSAVAGYNKTAHGFIWKYKDKEA